MDLNMPADDAIEAALYRISGKWEGKPYADMSRDELIKALRYSEAGILCLQEAAKELVDEMQNLAKRLGVNE